MLISSNLCDTVPEAIGGAGLVEGHVAVEAHSELVSHLIISSVILIIMVNGENMVSIHG